jgi:hypothetical protein
MTVTFRSFALIFSYIRYTVFRETASCADKLVRFFLCSVSYALRICSSLVGGLILAADSYPSTRRLDEVANGSCSVILQALSS